MYVWEALELDQVSRGCPASRSGSSPLLVCSRPGLTALAHHQEAGLVHRDVSNDQLPGEREEARDEGILPVLSPHRDPAVR